MAEHTIKLPDIGEGIAEAELVEWHVKEGDLVREDDDLAAVMTDKATVEIPAPVDGKIVWLGAKIGEMVAVGSDIIRIETAAGEAVQEVEEEEPVPVATPVVVEEEKQVEEPPVRQVRAASGGGRKPLASPAVRKRAQDNGIDLAALSGSGNDGQITHKDLDVWLNDDEAKPVSVPDVDTEATEIPVIGLRRKIAERMAFAKSTIPHITIVEEVDVTTLEGLRGKLNRSRRDDQPKLTLLPFMMMAMVKAIRTYPIMNAEYDQEAGVIRQHANVDIGIATQTSSGLMVPVIRNSEKRDVWDAAQAIKDLAERVRDGKADRNELMGSTITITSLGAIGGLVTTPIINYPEVAIVGINKIQVRPVWDGDKFIPRKMMNLSSSFDHRVIDGWDAANFVQDLKTKLEDPHDLLKSG